VPIYETAMPELQRVTLRVEEEIAYLCIDIPGERVNTLSAALIDEFEAVLGELQTREDVRGAVVHSAKDDFIVGFDIKEFAEYANDPERMRQVARKGHDLMSRIESLGIPFVAAIRGSCLGGGLEVALACHARVAADDERTKFGFPEVQLGLFPGGGGTQRLPRLVDLQLALDMILTAKNLGPRRALDEGLVDEVVHPSIVVEAAAQRARALAAARRSTNGKKSEGNGKRTSSTSLGDIVSDPMKVVAHTPARAIIFNRARDMVQKETGGHYPAPFAAIDCVEIGLRDGFEAGVAAEIERFADLVQTQVSKNLREIFFMKQAADKDSVVSKRTKPADVQRVGVLGAGLMGAGIAQVLAYNGYDVRMKDKDAAGLGWGLRYTKELFDKAVKTRRMSEAKADVAFGRISGTTTYDGFGRCDLVIEAVFEDADLKRKVIGDIEALGNENLILASNTSTIPIAKLARDASQPQNIIGMHFFSPVHKMPLVEIIKTKQTSARAIATTLAVARDMGKTCIVVNDGPGFFTSRVIGAYVNEAGWLLQEGASIEDIDTAMQKFGFPVGPMKLVDEVGIDVALKAGSVLAEAFEDRWDAPASLRNIAQDDRKGRKNGRGLYLYENGRAKGPDPIIYDLVGGGRQRKHFTEKTIQDRCWFAMLNECAYCLEEGIVEQPRDIEIGVIFGLGFPPFRGGILHHADQVGLQRVVDAMNQLADEYKERLRPASSLVEMANAGKKFFHDTRG
jgi:3-hydroxyacyl-CoA dehydrogenase / enoyl-CoA hydratase / 3-hydroxybutyryl-CoA epimerase